MKTKKKTYVLLVLVLGVWGTVAYKIVTALNPELPEIQTKEFAVKSNYRLDTKVDTFSIANVNRDPFLGTVTKPTKKKVVKVKTVQWKPVQYHGIIKKGNNQMFIVSISGKQQLLKKGQTKDSVTLVFGNAKVVTMRYRNSSKTFKIKEK